VSNIFNTWSTLLKAGDFVERMSNVLSTFGRLCRIRQNLRCRIGLCRQCVPALYGFGAIHKCRSL